MDISLTLTYLVVLLLQQIQAQPGNNLSYPTTFNTLHCVVFVYSTLLFRNKKSPFYLCAFHYLMGKYRITHCNRCGYSGLIGFRKTDPRAVNFLLYPISELDYSPFTTLVK